MSLLFLFIYTAAAPARGRIQIDPVRNVAFIVCTSIQ